MRGGRTVMGRLGSMVAAILVGVLAMVPVSRPASADGRTPSLPGPTGRQQVGTVSLHLVDSSRRDPWVPSHPPRELMVQLWYPATHTAGHPRARYIPALAGQSLDAQTAQQLATSVPAGTFHSLRTHAYQGAPIERPRERGRPVVLFSPGDGMDRSSLTGIAEELASHGFFVVGMDDTHDSAQVEFPGGRVEVAQPIPPEKADQETLVRTGDARFTLDQLATLNAGGDPDADHQRLPDFRHAIDLRRTGMFGHSHGAEAAAETLLQDHRVTAGLELDGGVSQRVAAAGLDAPFMVISGDSPDGHPKTEENLTTLWPNLTGWNRWLRLLGAGHLAFTDFETFAPQLGTPPDVEQQWFGTIDPVRAMAAERAYLLAFFTQQLDQRHERILDRPSARYPEVRFER